MTNIPVTLPKVYMPTTAFVRGACQTFTGMLHPSDSLLPPSKPLQIIKITRLLLKITLEGAIRPLIGIMNRARKNGSSPRINDRLGRCSQPGATRLNANLSPSGDFVDPFGSCQCRKGGGSLVPGRNPHARQTRYTPSLASVIPSRQEFSTHTQRHTSPPSHPVKTPRSAPLGRVKQDPRSLGRHLQTLTTTTTAPSPSALSMSEPVVLAYPPQGVLNLSHIGGLQ